MRRSLILVTVSLALAACGPKAEEKNTIDADGDGYFADASNEVDIDCDDLQPAINPDQVELCNGVDDDCNGIVDDESEEAFLWYPDKDDDGFGAPLPDEAITACFRPPLYSGNQFDCNDFDPEIFKGAQERCNEIDDDCDLIADNGLDFGTSWYADRDRDGFGGGEPVSDGCSTDPSWVLNNDDCNDVLDSVRPDAPEICDGIDNDCDRLIDDADDNVEGARRWYQDFDADGYGNILASLVSCGEPAGFVTNALDCNDENADQNPETVWYRDDDLDLHGDPNHLWGEDTFGEPVEQCWQPIGYTLYPDDCNDSDSRVHRDSEWHPDADRDGYGSTLVVGIGCASQPGWVLSNTDCDDRDFDHNPDTPEVCNGFDDNCDGLIDDDDPVVTNRPTRYPDGDGDGFGTELGAIPSCNPGPGYANQAGDCNDSLALLNPGTTWYADLDRDGHGDPNNPFATTQCEIVPGYLPYPNDCDDTDPQLHDDTEWYTDQDRDGVGVGITPVAFGCITNPRRAVETGDCDDNNASDNLGGCFGPQRGLIEVAFSTDEDALGLAVLIECDDAGEAFATTAGESDANTSYTEATALASGDTCTARLYNAAGDPSGDGYGTVEIIVCGVSVGIYDLDQPLQVTESFDITRCSGCFDPNAQNFDPTVLVPNNPAQACIY